MSILAKSTKTVSLASNSISQFNPTAQSASSFSIILPGSLPLDVGQWFLAVYQFSAFNTQYNITQALNNNTIRYSPDSGTSYNTVVFPDGLYSISDLITLFADGVTANGDTAADIVLSIVLNQITCEWTLKNGYYVDMSYGNIYQNLGFAKQLYVASAVGPNQADISNGVTNYLVGCNLVDAGSSIVNGNFSNVIYSYYPTTAAPGQLYTPQISTPMFLPCIRSKTNVINITITDQLGRPVSLETTPGANPTSLTLLLVQQLDTSAFSK